MTYGLDPSNLDGITNVPIVFYGIPIPGVRGAIELLNVPEVPVSATWNETDFHYQYRHAQIQHAIQMTMMHYGIYIHPSDVSTLIVNIHGPPNPLEYITTNPYLENYILNTLYPQPSTASGGSDPYNYSSFKQDPAPANGTRNLPKGATNAISFEPIEAGTPMVNFHGESVLESPRFYTYNSFKALKPKINPFTRNNIKPTNVTRYRARGGKKSRRIGKLSQHKP